MPRATASVRSAPQQLASHPCDGLKHGFTSSHLRFRQWDGFEHGARWQSSEEPAHLPQDGASYVVPGGTLLPLFVQALTLGSRGYRFDGCPPLFTRMRIAQSG